MKQDVWKRDLPSAVDDAANVMSGYEQQLELPLNKTVEATPEQFEAWRKEDYWNRGDYDPLVMFVVIPTIVQLMAMGLMFAVMYLNSILF